MPLIICSECGRSISTRAAHCIHCGCPLSAMDAAAPEPLPPARPTEAPLELTTTSVSPLSPTPTSMQEYTAISDPVVVAEAPPPQPVSRDASKPAAPLTAAPKESRSRAPGVAWLLAVMVGLGTYVAIDGYVGLWNMPARFGYYLVSGTLLWLLFYAVVAKRYGRGLPFMSFLGIYGALIAGSTVRHENLQRNEQQAKASLAADLERVAKAMDSGSTTVRTSPVQSQGDMGKIEAMVKAFLDRSQALRSANDAETSRAGSLTLLDADRLLKDQDLVESRLIIKRSREAYKRMRAEWNAVLDDYLRQANALDIAPNVRANVVQEATTSVGVARTRVMTMFDIQEESMTEGEAIISMLTANQGRWSVQNGMMIFDTDQLVDQYNALNGKILRLGERLRKVQEEAQRDRKAAVDNLRKEPGR